MEMFGFGGKTEDQSTADELRDKAADQLSAPTEEEYGDVKEHVRRCGLRYYLTRAEVRAVRADLRRVRAEIGGIRLILIAICFIMLVQGANGPLVSFILKALSGVEH